MAEQSYQNHTHHPTATYVAAVFSLLALVLFIGYLLFGWDTANWTIAAVLGAVMALTAISRWYIVRL